MTNPDNAVGTNGAYGGRTSVNAFNDNLSAYTSRGIISGWLCTPSSGMSVSLGGTSGTRDVAVAEDPNGNRTTINNISGQPVEVAISAAPATNSRIDSIVAYVENPPAGSSTEVDNPAACGIIAVSGTTAASPSAPSDATIRSAITADGGTGSTAYYVVLANVTVASGTTDITSDNITSGEYAGIGSNNIDWETLPVLGGNSDEIIVGYFEESGVKKPVYRKTFTGSVSATANQEANLALNIPNIDKCVDVRGAMNNYGSEWLIAGSTIFATSQTVAVMKIASGVQIRYRFDTAGTKSYWFVIDYTKNA